MDELEKHAGGGSGGAQLTMITDLNISSFSSRVRYSVNKVSLLSATDARIFTAMFSPKPRPRVARLHLRRPRAKQQVRYASGGAVEQPPPAGGQLPSVATSSLLRTTRDAALRSRGLIWRDELEQDAVGGRETRKMNVYQAVRDAMRCATDLYDAERCL